METSSPEASVRAFYRRHKDKGKIYVITHFKNDGYSKSTIYRYLAKEDHGYEVGDGRRNNGARPKLNKKQVRQLERRFQGRDDVSQRSAGEAFGVDHSTISRTLKNRTNIKFYKKKKAPMYKPGQEIAVKHAADRLYRRHLTGVNKDAFIIMDDETYIDENGAFSHGSSGYYATSPTAASESVRFKNKKKFPMKVGIWWAVSEKGVSDYFCWPSGRAVNQKIYETECLKKRLVPFIERYHANDKILFWPDKASSHYAKKTIQFLNRLRIPLVPYDDNPTNLPQARPIEDLHNILKKRIFRDNFRPRDEDELLSRVDAAMQELRTTHLDLVIKSMKRVRGLVRKVARDGVYAAVH